MDDITFSRGGFDHKITLQEDDDEYVAWTKSQKDPEAWWMPWLAVTTKIPESNVQWVVEQEINQVERG